MLEFTGLADLFAGEVHRLITASVGEIIDRQDIALVAQIDIGPGTVFGIDDGGHAVIGDILDGQLPGLLKGGRVDRFDAVIAAEGHHGLEVLGAHDGAHAAASEKTVPGGDIGITHPVLAGRADDQGGRVFLVHQLLLNGDRIFAPPVGGVLEGHVLGGNLQVNRTVGLAPDQQAVPAGGLQVHAESPAAGG